MKKNLSQMKISTLVLGALLLSAVLIGIPTFIYKGQIAAILLTILGWLILMAIGAAIAGGDFKVSVYSSHSKAGYGEQYRLEKDNPSVIRVRERPPLGPEGKKFVSYLPDVQVSGTSRRKKEVEEFIFGKKRQVRLEREPDNPHDHNAIQVYGSWMTPDGEREEEFLGYIEKDIAADIAKSAPNYPIEAVIDRMFFKHGKYSAGLRLNLFWPGAQWRKQIDKAMSKNGSS